MNLLVKIVTFISVAHLVNANPMEFKKKECFDPRTAIVQCQEGTEFQGWDQGSCQDGLVEGPICKETCFDPTAAFILCKEGTEFQGWNVGTCEDGLVESAICE